MTVVTGVAEYPENILDTLKKDHKVVSIDAMDEAKKLGNSACLTPLLLVWQRKIWTLTNSSG